MILTRRAILAGGAALALPVEASGPDDAITTALDRAQQEPDPSRALALLAGLSATSLPHHLVLDLETARAGLVLDATRGGDRFALRMQRTLGSIAPAFAQSRLSTELRGLLTRADALFARLGDDAGSVGDRYRRLWRDESQLYADSDAGRAAAVADMNRILAGLRRHTIAAFRGIPASCLDVSIRALTPAEIAAGRGGYRTLPDPGKPGAYAVDLEDIRRRPRWSLPSVVAHELLPGHMVQLLIEAAARPHPLRLRYAAAFVEGWSIYAEELAAGWGVFSNPRVALGHVHWLLFRVARGLVDIGINSAGWSTAEARARFTEWLGEPAYFAPFDSDLDRIARDPGIRAAEAMAWLAIADRARSLRGKALVRFHHALLTNGRLRTDSMPRYGQTS